MSKVKLGSGIVNYPMPVALVGTKVEGKVNFLTVAWISMVSYNPPKIAVTLGSHHHSNIGIKEQKAFSICFPSEGHMKAVDFCGIYSGEKTDKSRIFKTFDGEITGAPMIEEFSLNIECKLDKIVANGANETFIGDIAEIYADESVLTDGKVDFEKLNPLILGQLTAEYHVLGAKTGKAWSDGKQFGK